jgi:hypothetical protein
MILFEEFEFRYKMITYVLHFGQDYLAHKLLLLDDS